MKRSDINGLIVSVLALLTLAALLIDRPSGENWQELINVGLVWASLTAYALVFGVALADGEISSAHGAGVLALLALDASAQPIMTWGSGQRGGGDWQHRCHSPRRARGAPLGVDGCRAGWLVAFVRPSGMRPHPVIRAC
ncbi:MAG: hypothetical protein HC828_19495, partial [Blastochloris sp.]|nr:hypothetical protein [Blastochloris sp.]